MWHFDNFWASFLYFLKNFWKAPVVRAKFALFLTFPNLTIRAILYLGAPYRCAGRRVSALKTARPAVLPKPAKTL